MDQRFQERYFIIKNDVGNHYPIDEENDDESTKKYKIEQKMKEYAVFDPQTKHWKMRLPHWFTQSEYEYKVITLESFSYFKADGTLDLGTTFHSPTLSDAEFAQFDHMISLANDGIQRSFFIDGKNNYIDFWFKDYLDEECLSDVETYTVQKTDEFGNKLYWGDVPISNLSVLPTNTTLTANEFPKTTSLTLLVPYNDIVFINGIKNQITSDEVLGSFNTLYWNTSYDDTNPFSFVWVNDTTKFTSDLFSVNSSQYRKIYVNGFDLPNYPDNIYYAPGMDISTGTITEKYVKTTRVGDFPVITQMTFWDSSYYREKGWVGQQVYCYFYMVSHSTSPTTIGGSWHFHFEPKSDTNNPAARGEYDSYINSSSWFVESWCWPVYIHETNKQKQKLYWTKEITPISTKKDLENSIPLLTKVRDWLDYEYKISYDSVNNPSLVYATSPEGLESQYYPYILSGYYQTVPENYKIEINTEVSEYPYYTPVLGSNMNPVYIEYNSDMIPTITEGMTQYNLYTQAKNKNGEKLYYHLKKETNDDSSGKSVYVDEEYKTCFIVVCKLRY